MTCYSGVKATIAVATLETVTFHSGLCKFNNVGVSLMCFNAFAQYLGSKCTVEFIFLIFK